MKMMKPRVTVFNAKSYDIEFLSAANGNGDFEVSFVEARLSDQTSSLAQNSDVVCVFVNDELNARVIEHLSQLGVKLIALRCAGFNNVDLLAAKKHQLTVMRVPAYSPHAVAEHTVGLMLALNRRIHRAYNRVREGDFRLRGLMGFDLFEKTIGIIGTGSIGKCVAKIMMGFECRVLAFDIHEDSELKGRGVEYATVEDVYRQSDIITLHCPLNETTKHLIDNHSLQTMKSSVMIINTSRGGLVDTEAMISGLKSGKIGSLGLDVYEEEAELFFEDRSEDVLQDDMFARLLTFPNVIITGHQAFFTREAVANIAETTLNNVKSFFAGEVLRNVVTAPSP